MTEFVLVSHVWVYAIYGDKSFEVSLLLALGFCQIEVVLSVFQLTDVVSSIVMGFCFVDLPSMRRFFFPIFGDL